MSFIDELGDALARDTLAAVAETGDASLVNEVSKVLGAASQTMQEAFMTSIRVRMAEVKAREYLAARLATARAEAETIDREFISPESDA
ncbi:hypothetical protein [Phaeovulum sp. W22_SRMD_FR3]|uniref:hypothetical protein n=1 Tax=Phaeovulum sp. W22_SRMD_FR3 TaxID=3240274 RepID=UPI003F9B04DB